MPNAQHEHDDDRPRPPWPLGRMPTALELLDWLATLKPSQQVEILGRLLDTADVGARCVASDHAGYLLEAARRAQRDPTPSWPCHEVAELVHTDGPCQA